MRASCRNPGEDVGGLDEAVPFQNEKEGTRMGNTYIIKISWIRMCGGGRQGVCGMTARCQAWGTEWMLVLTTETKIREGERVWE